MNLYTDLRYCNGLSGAKAQLSNGTSLGEHRRCQRRHHRRRGGGGWNLQASRDWTLYVEAGPGRADPRGNRCRGGTTIDNELEALLVRFGAVFGL
ncbi:MAG: hypothetical protein U1F77_17365 [Kiritimatiellia bacterium]